jgi:hypothetical protein
MPGVLPVVIEQPIGEGRGTISDAALQSVQNQGSSIAA